MKILFLIRSLNYGGAERQITILVKGLRKRGYDVKMVVFYDGGPIEADLRNAGVPVVQLHKKSRWDMFGFLWRLVRILKSDRPDVLHGYLEVPNILTVMLKPFFPNMKMVWGVRSSIMDLERYDWLSRLSYRVECKLARYADLIISNSQCGMEYAVRHGFPSERMAVIPNGIDTELFRSDLQAGKRMREAWGITENNILIGLIGRLDPMKDHHTFLKAAALFAEQRKEVHFVCVGDGPEQYKSSLQTLAGELELNGRLIWAGSFRDMPAVYNALDIVTSSSYGEGFPNAVGEAMACGIPCVVTDVGDSAVIVGSTGVVVPPKSPEALAEGWWKVVQSFADKNKVEQLTRDRIISNFSVEALVTRTAAALAGLIVIKSP